MELPTHYDSKTAEKKWLEYWEREKIYRFDQNSAAPIYSIDTPPPTVSGKMHIGHSFSYSQQDFVARYKRMRGYNVFYPFGTDDNGLATERLIERMKNVKGQFMKRGEFVELCLKTLQEIRPDFVADWKILGISADFSIFYTTIDKHCQRISQKSFIDLFAQKRIYRKRSPFVWCPECQTAIAQVEMKDKEQQSQFVFMKFDTSLGEQITIATTRPELLPACVAIHVHPDDTRYQKFIGAQAKIPFSERTVTIEANKDVQMDFGTGVVYHCTFGDMDDVKWLEEYGLTAIEILNKNGTLNEKAGRFAGLHIKKARTAVIKALQDDGRLEKLEPITHVVNVHERCDTDIEILMTDQWFVKYLELKEAFIAQGKKMNWYPPHMRARYDNWIAGLKWDWCISRQRHFGVPIPVWYCTSCHAPVVADEKQLPLDPLQSKPQRPCPCGGSEFTPEKDVLDTWATSSVTPQIVRELFAGTTVYDKLFPMSLRPQAHDIITFWLFNTVVKSYLHQNSVPWDTIMISGWALDPHGKKMSKSKGNVISPQEMIDKYSADCLRFWAATSTLGDDLPFQEKDLVTGKKFATKLWNAFRFSHTHLAGHPIAQPQELHTTDRWLLAKLTTLVKNATESFESYEYSKTKLETEQFFWGVFCDNYLELIKDRLYNPQNHDTHAVESARYTLYTGFLTILKLMAPITPYVTEEIYQAYFKEFETKKSIHLTPWPGFTYPDVRAEALGDFVIQILTHVRKEKSTKNLSLKAPLKKIKILGKISSEEFRAIMPDLIPLVVCENITYEQLSNTQKNVEIEIEW